MSQAPLSPEKNIEIVEAYQAGYNVKSISRQVRVSMAAIYRALRRAEIYAPYRQANEISVYSGSLNHKAICAAYSAGTPLCDLVRIFGRPPSTIRDILKVGGAIAAKPDCTPELHRNDLAARVEADQARRDAPRLAALAAHEARYGVRPRDILAMVA